MSENWIFVNMVFPLNELLNFWDSETLINPENFQKKVPIFGGFPVQSLSRFSKIFGMSIPKIGDFLLIY